MKQRLLSAAIAIIICIYPLLYGGITLNLLVFLIGIIGLYEFINCLKKPISYKLLFVCELTFLLLLYFISLICILIIILFIIAIYDENININDVFGSAMMTMIISYAILFVINLYASNKGKVFFYILIASLLTDTGAYLIGRRFGKHKLNERVSPKKTIEGSIGGIIFGFVFSILFAFLNSCFGLPIYIIIICSILLPIISEFGDLAFSLIKRHYGIKDFGNIMPGHGGVLDRIDSVIFCLLLFSIIYNFL